jgi:hypothetical protein
VLPSFDLAHVGSFDLSAVTQLFLRDPQFGSEVPHDGAKSARSSGLKRL